MSIRIAFAGPANAGKDLAAAYLLNKHGGHRLAFADLLKQGYRAMVEHFGIPYTKERELLQHLGMWARTTKPGCFIDPVIEAVRQEPTLNYFVTDLRFADEAVTLRDEGFVLVNIDRPHLPDSNAAWRQHPSERGMDGFNEFHFTVKNCSHLDHYYGQLDALWQEVIEARHLQHNNQMVNIV